MADEAPTPSPAVWIEAVRRIVDATRSSDVSELQIASGAFRVRVRRDPSAVVGAPASADEAPGEVPDHLYQVAAPLTGIFYRAASPSARPYVEEGDWVDADTVVGLVETMKIFNEVTADRSGRVTAVLADSGQLVHAGDPLLTLAPGERTPAEPERSL